MGWFKRFPLDSGANEVNKGGKQPPTPPPPPTSSEEPRPRPVFVESVSVAEPDNLVVEEVYAIALEAAKDNVDSSAPQSYINAPIIFWLAKTLLMFINLYRQQRQEIARHHRDFERWEEMADKGAKQLDTVDNLRNTLTKTDNTVRMLLRQRQALRHLLMEAGVSEETIKLVEKGCEPSGNNAEG